MHVKNNRTASRRRYKVDISLSTDQLKAFYAGHVFQVSARDRSGVRLQFPLQSLRPFISHEGVSGTFQIDVTSDNKLKAIRKL